MQRVRVKIEGLRDPATAVQIALMGADAIGLVFADSPRQVTADRAAQVVRALPPWVATVGVFVNTEPEAINAIIAETRVGYVQLHGDEQPDVVGQINVPCIKAFRIRDAESVAAIADWTAAAGDNLAAVLLDAYDPAARGGTGKQFNWQLAAELKCDPPVILAGGLKPDNVRQAIETVKPWGVDVASGVESSPGEKDMAKVAGFIQAAGSAGD